MLWTQRFCVDILRVSGPAENSGSEKKARLRILLYTGITREYAKIKEKEKSKEQKAYFLPTDS